MYSSIYYIFHLSRFLFISLPLDAIGSEGKDGLSSSPSHPMAEQLNNYQLEQNCLEEMGLSVWYSPESSPSVRQSHTQQECTCWMGH